MQSSGVMCSRDELDHDAARGWTWPWADGRWGGACVLSKVSPGQCLPLSGHRETAFVRACLKGSVWLFTVTASGSIARNVSRALAPPKGVPRRPLGRLVRRGQKAGRVRGAQGAGPGGTGGGGGHPCDLQMVLSHCRAHFDRRGGKRDVPRSTPGFGLSLLEMQKATLAW